MQARGLRAQRAFQAIQESKRCLCDTVVGRPVEARVGPTLLKPETRVLLAFLRTSYSYSCCGLCLGVLLETSEMLLPTPPENCHPMVTSQRLRRYYVGDTSPLGQVNEHGAWEDKFPCPTRFWFHSVSHIKD